MTKIRRWLDRRRRVVWTEPTLPPYVKINPDAADPDPDAGLQPGELSMGKIAQEFLNEDDVVSDGLGEGVGKGVGEGLGDDAPAPHS